MRQWDELEPTVDGGICLADDLTEVQHLLNNRETYPCRAASATLEEKASRKLFFSLVFFMSFWVGLPRHRTAFPTVAKSVQRTTFVRRRIHKRNELFLTAIRGR